jgi:hypothetical protein
MHPDATRQVLFEKLVVSVLEDRPAGGSRNKELVSLPLDDVEESWFQNFLTRGAGSKLKLAAATIETRLIITGRHGGQIRIRGLEDNSAVSKSTRSTRSTR